MALCRASASPPEGCYTFPDTAPVAFQTGGEGSNAGLDRDTLVVLVSDEGDSSYRNTGGSAPAVAGDVEIVVDACTAILSALSQSPRVIVAGPGYDGADGSCLDGAQEWGVERYQGVAIGTGGSYEPLTDLAADCAPLDAEEFLVRVAAAAAE